MRIAYLWGRVLLFANGLFYGKQNVYQCDHCHRVFRKGIPDAEAWEEHDGLFPGASHSTAAIVCDDCWKWMRGEA